MVAIGSHSLVVAQRLFENVPGSSTGVTFRPSVYDVGLSKDSLRTINLMVPGSGVGIGDLDGDGKPDIVVGGNNGVAVYRNDGAFRFTNVTTNLGLQNSDLIFTTGVLIVDIDNDGDNDIFLSRWRHPCKLFINNGKGVFSEQGAIKGLDIVAEVTHAVAFDADRDGRLDIYLAVYSKISDITYANAAAAKSPTASRANPSTTRHYGAPDVFFRQTPEGTFVDATAMSGFDDEGMSLSATASDIDGDGDIDLYVANDMNLADILFLNDGKGLFSRQKKSNFRRYSAFSMGCDIADLDGDGRFDLMTTDMLPSDHIRRITNAGPSGDQSIYNPTFDSNQIMRNMVQINRGAGVFSDVGYMTGLAATDWSWACLIADYDLDGKQDVFIANGYTADITNQDYVYNLSRTDGLPSTAKFLREPNRAFRQTSTLNFDDVSASWGLDDVSASLGAAYGDLDGDGDLDLVVSNIDTVVFVYRNTAEATVPNNRVIRVDLGPVNAFNHGAIVTIVSGNQRWKREYVTVRGFESSVDAPIHVGIGMAQRIDSIIVDWPNGRRSVSMPGELNGRTYVANFAPSTATEATPKRLVSKPLMTRLPSPPYKHIENTFDDFKRYRLMPTRVSWGGPAIAVADLDADGRDDLVIGSALGSTTTVLLQRDGGTWERTLDSLFVSDRRCEDQVILVADFTHDGQNDILIAGGGAEFDPDGPEFRSRLYTRRNGRWTVTHDVFPFTTNAAAMCAMDFDNDGDLDVFVGGGVRPDRYPECDRSALLINDGAGRFRDVTDSLSPDLRNCGIVRSAVWTDTDLDGTFELVVVGEWMAPQIWKRRGSHFVNTANESGTDTLVGWWYSVTSADVDNDGDMDLICGNIGLNTRYRPQANKPIEIWYDDFDENGSVDGLITYWPDSVRRLVRDRMKIFSQMPTLNRQFNKYVDFATASFETMIDADKRQRARKHEAREMRSLILVNNGKGVFTPKPLPPLAQISPVLGVAVVDLDNDDYADLILSGNMYGAEDDVVRYDAGVGIVLQGAQGATYRALDPDTSGYRVASDMRGTVTAILNGKAVTITGVNGDSLVIYAIPGQYVTSPIRSNETYTNLRTESGIRRVESTVGQAWRSQGRTILPSRYVLDSKRVKEKPNRKEPKHDN